MAINEREFDQLCQDAYTEIESIPKAPANTCRRGERGKIREAAEGRPLPVS
jgi:hypothetical protein